MQERLVGLYAKAVCNHCKSAEIMLFIRETRLFVCKISHEKADCGSFSSFQSSIKVFLNFSLLNILSPNYFICTLWRLNNAFCNRDMMTNVYFFGKSICSPPLELGRQGMQWLRVAKQHTFGSYEGQVDNNCVLAETRGLFRFWLQAVLIPPLLEIPWFTSKSLCRAL